jgi:hypothetical protein
MYLDTQKRVFFLTQNLIGRVQTLKPVLHGSSPHFCENHWFQYFHRHVDWIGFSLPQNIRL